MQRAASVLSSKLVDRPCGSACVVVAAAAAAFWRHAVCSRPAESVRYVGSVGRLAAGRPADDAVRRNHYHPGVESVSAAAAAEQGARSAAAVARGARPPALRDDPSSGCGGTTSPASGGTIPSVRAGEGEGARPGWSSVGLQTSDRKCVARSVAGHQLSSAGSQRPSSRGPADRRRRSW